MPTLEIRRTKADEKADGTYAAALAFALADYRWQILSADRHRWTEPDGLRALTAAFLRYHSAKLALEALPGDPPWRPSVSTLPPNPHLAA